MGGGPTQAAAHPLPRGTPGGPKDGSGTHHEQHPDRPRQSDAVCAPEGQRDRQERHVGRRHGCCAVVHAERQERAFSGCAAPCTLNMAARSQQRARCAVWAPPTLRPSARRASAGCCSRPVDTGGTHRGPPHGRAAAGASVPPPAAPAGASPTCQQLHPTHSQPFKRGGWLPRERRHPGPNVHAYPASHTACAVRGQRRTRRTAVRRALTGREQQAITAVYSSQFQRPTSCPSHQHEGLLRRHAVPQLHLLGRHRLASEHGSVHHATAARQGGKGGRKRARQMSAPRRCGAAFLAAA